MKLLIVISAFLLPFIALADKIEGFAAEQIGQDVRLLRYDDYISRKTVEIAKGSVGKDSTFTLEFETDETFEAILEVGNTYGYIYIQPDCHYKVGVPLLKDAVHAGKNNVQLAFLELPEESDINFLILDLDYRIDGFVGNTYQILANKEWKKRLENFEAHLTEVYATVENTFFINYMTYKVANLELIGNPGMDIGVHKELVYQVYLEKAPVLSKNNAYMQMVNGFYKNIFGSITAYHERSLMTAFITENIDSLKHILGQHAHFKNPQLNEMILIKGLGESYMTGRYPTNNILNMLQDLKKDANYPTNRKIAGNMIGKLTKLVKGYPAPDFELKSDEGELVSLKKFRGKYVYLTFFEEWSSESLSEFRIMQKLQERYGQHFEFVSICLGPDSSSLDRFIKKYPEFDWTFLNGYHHQDLIDYYEVKSYPLYYMIDPQGYLYQSPALSPSPKGNYESVDKTMYQINRSLSKREEMRPPGSRPPHAPQHGRPRGG